MGKRSRAYIALSVRFRHGSFPGFFPSYYRSALLYAHTLYEGMLVLVSGLHPPSKQPQAKTQIAHNQSGQNQRREKSLYTHRTHLIFLGERRLDYFSPADDLLCSPL